MPTVQCSCSRPATDYLSLRGEEYDLGPPPYSDHCTHCTGRSFTHSEVDERNLWYYRLLVRIRKARKGAMFKYDKEEQLYQALKVKYGSIA